MLPQRARRPERRIGLRLCHHRGWYDHLGRADIAAAGLGIATGGNAALTLLLLLLLLAIGRR